MTYLLIGFSVTWGLIAAYIILLGKRQSQIRKEMKQLEEWAQE